MDVNGVYKAVYNLGWGTSTNAINLLGKKEQPKLLGYSTLYFDPYPNRGNCVHGNPS